MRSKLYLKNLTKSALLFVSLILFISGCYCPSEPTYKEKDIPSLVKKICKDEYKLNVTTQRAGSTLWIYAPVDKILHKDYGVKEDKVFDDDIAEKLRNILTTIGRVLISSDNTPQFFALMASDIKLGIDYTIIGNVLDIKKTYAEFIPWTEANRRYVVKFSVAAEAVGDNTGIHLNAYDITLPDFLAQQISQRLAMEFQGEKLKKYFKIIKSEGTFNNGIFDFEYQIETLTKPPKKINMYKEILKIANYCLKTYEFTDFSQVRITEAISRDRIDYNKAAVLNAPEI